MTSVAPAVPQLLLPGQAAAPEGPVDLAPMYLMHRAFRRDLDAFARTVPAVPPSDAARWVRLARRFALVVGERERAQPREGGERGDVADPVPAQLEDAQLGQRGERGDVGEPVAREVE